MIPMHTAMRQAREARGWTQKALGERTGIDPRTVWAYENGRAIPSVLRAAELATALGVSVDVYIGLRPPPRRKKQ